MELPSEPDDLQVEEREACSEGATDAPEDGAGEDSQDVHVDAAGDVEEDVAVGLELSEGALVAEPREGRVEEVRREGAHHAAEERLPRQLHVPVRRYLQFWVEIL